MIRALQIENFRGIRSIAFQALPRINLLAGANDVGKTSVLEALALFCACGRMPIHEFPTLFRSGKGHEPAITTHDQMAHFWAWLVHEGAEQGRVRTAPIGSEALVLTFGPITKPHGTTSPGGFSLRLAQEQGDKYFEIHLTPNGGASSTTDVAGQRPRCAVLSTYPSSPIADAKLYNTAALRGEAEATIERVLRVIEPRLKKLRFLQAPGTSVPLVHADVGLKRLVPSSQMGQGFTRVLNICCQVLAAEADVVLIDEIENGVYHEAMPQVWLGIKEICRAANVQIFATTHSLECIRAAHEAYRPDDDYDFALHRLQRVGGNVEAVTHTRDMLEVALTAPSALEVR